MEEKSIVKEEKEPLFEKVHDLIKEILKPMYARGETKNLLDKSEDMLKKLKTPEHAELISETKGCRAWAFYRQKEFAKAEEEAKDALKYAKSETALRCLAAIAAYFHKDSVQLEFYASQVPNSPAIDSARTILARQPGNQSTEDEIVQRALHWTQIDPIDRINVANLMNNTSRWLFDYANKLILHHDDLIIKAIGFMQAAIGLYGSGSQNLHHRAGAYFWISKMQEKLFGKTSAISAAEMSVLLWKEQLVLDITNKNFINSYEGAKKHLEGLKEPSK